MIIKLTTSLLLLICFSVQAEVQVYKVERVVSSRSDSYGDNVHGLALPLAQIEIGAVIHV